MMAILSDMNAKIAIQFWQLLSLNLISATNFELIVLAYNNFWYLISTKIKISEIILGKPFVKFFNLFRFSEQ